MRNNIIAIGNQKGGVGKTTTTHNLGAALALQGKKVLIIDLDPEANLTISCGYDPLSSFDCTIVDLFNDKNLSASEAIYELEEIPGLSLVPSTPDFAVTELNLSSQRAREYKLKRIIEPMIDIFDYILIDCPPQLSFLTLNAFTAADNIIIPCETSTLSYFAMARALRNTINGAREDLNPNLHVIGVIATLFNTLENTDKEVLETLEKEEIYPLLGVIRRAAASKKGFKKGLPVVINDPNAGISQTYSEIAKKIIKEFEACL